MDYKETLNLPATDFPMRGNLPQREPEIMHRWTELDLDRKLSEPNQEKPNFTLHDGPPYANGTIHMPWLSHGLSILDFILREENLFKTLQ